MNAVAVSVFVFLFLLVTVLGFAAVTFDALADADVATAATISAALPTGPSTAG